MTTESIHAFLENDHKEIDGIFSTLCRDLGLASEGAKISGNQLGDQFRMFDSRLERHIHWEEELLFPSVEALNSDLREGPGQVMRMEHEEIRRLKKGAGERIGKSPGADECKKALAELKEMFSILKDHNMKEEHIYYPMADELMPEDERKRMLGTFRSTPSL